MFGDENVQTRPEDVAVYRQAWQAYQYGDRDPHVKVMARAYERWLALQQPDWKWLSR